MPIHYYFLYDEVNQYIETSDRYVLHGWNKQN